MHGKEHKVKALVCELFDFNVVYSSFISMSPHSMISLHFDRKIYKSLILDFRKCAILMTWRVDGPISGFTCSSLLLLGHLLHFNEKASFWNVFSMKVRVLHMHDKSTPEVTRC